MKMIASPNIKTVVWIGSTRADLASFPEDVKDAIGYALYIAQRGGKRPDAKPLRGFGGAGILEIVEDHAGDTYRRRAHGPLGGSHICLARVSEEIKGRDQDAESGD
jgi:phage-related protein